MTRSAGAASFLSMPIPIKVLLSALVAALGAFMWRHEHAAGAADVAWAAAALAALMIFGVWLFPDTRRGS